MIATFTVREIRDGLEITSTAHESTGASILSAIVISLVVGLLAHQYVGWTGTTAATLCAGALAFVLSKRQRKAVLHATNCEFRLLGDFGDEHQNRRDVSRASIRWLEYQDARGGGDVPYAPSGVYAELGRGSVCIVPYLNAEQADLAIAAIYNHFPDMPWDKKTAFDGHVTTLDLNGSG